MATLRNKRKLAAVTSETQEEHPRNGQSRNTSVPKVNEEYILQVSEEIEGRVTKKLSQEFSRTESRILGALSDLDEFLLNPQIRTHSGTVPGTFRNTNLENQRTNEDDSQIEPHPESGIFRSQTTHNSGPEDGHDMVTGGSEEIRNGLDMVAGGSEEIRNGHDMVTEAQEEISYRPHMVTGIQEDIPYYSFGFFSRKQKKARSTSQPPFRSENTPATNEADQICWPFSSWRATATPPTSTTTLKNFKTAKILYDNKAHLRPEVNEIWTIGRSIPNELKNPQSAHRRGKNILFPFSHAWWCTADVQKHQQPELRESNRNSDCSVENTWNPIQWLRQNTNFNN